MSKPKAGTSPRRASRLPGWPRKAEARAASAPLLVLVACAAAWISGARDARATTLLPLTLEKLVGWSDVIALGRCEELWGEQDAGGIIRTRVRFRVEETWKGSASGVIALVHLGGTIDRTIADVPGSPRFEPGEEVLLFLQAFADGTYGVVGLFQGKFAISGVEAREATVGGGGRRERLVGRDGPADERDRAGVGGGSMRLLGIDDIARPDGRVSLEDFEGRVRRLLAGEVPPR